MTTLEQSLRCNISDALEVSEMLNELERLSDEDTDKIHEHLIEIIKILKQ